MVNEINKIIYNLLISGKEVCIGGVGTLLTMRYAAYRASKKSMVPPYRIVIFTTEQRGVSLEEEIARVAGVDAARAHELFEQWMSEVLEGDTLKIEGIGSLRNDKFISEESFLATLNPLGRTPMRLKPKANVGLYIFASLCVLFALAVAGYVYLDSRDIVLFGKEAKIGGEVAVAENVKPEPAVEDEPVMTEMVDSVDVAQSVTEPAMQTATQEQLPTRVVDVADTSEIRSTEPGWSYVVLGVFSTTENAERAIGEAQRVAGELRCVVYHYGNKYMVALYDSQSRAECQEFARSMGGKFKDLWIYSRK